MSASIHPGRRGKARMILRTLCRLLPVALLVLVGGTPALADCEGAKPVFYLAFWSDTQTADQITDFADRIAGNHLRTLPGVADVCLFGDRRLVVRIRPDPSALTAYGLAPHDVEEALRRQNLELSQDADQGTIELRVAEINPLPPSEFGNIVLSQEVGYPVRLQDVATIELVIGGARTIAHYKGRDVVALGIINQPNVGMLAVWFAVSQSLPAIRSLMPPDMQLEPASPFSLVIERLSRE